MLKCVLIFCLIINAVVACNSSEIDIDTAKIDELKDVAVKKALSIKLLENQIQNQKIDLKQQNIKYWLVPSVTLGAQIDSEKKEIKPNTGINFNFDKFFFKGNDDRQRAKIRLNDTEILLKREIERIKSEVEKRYISYTIIKERIANLNENEKLIDKQLKKSTSDVLFLLKKQTIDSIYQAKTELNQKRSELEDIINGR